MKTCGVCSHPERREIERAILSGDGVRNVAARFGTSSTALQRHKAHISKRLEKGFALREIAEAESLAQRIELLLTESVDILEDARTTWVKADCLMCKAKIPVQINDVRSRVAAAAQVGKTLELVGRLTGEIQSSSTQVINLFASLGVKDESEIRRALELTRSGDEVSLDDCFEESLALLQFCLRERPELRHSALRRLDVSHAEVLGNPESGSVGSQAPGEAGGDAMGLRP